MRLIGMINRYRVQFWVFVVLVMVSAGAGLFSTIFVVNKQVEVASELAEFSRDLARFHSMLVSEGFGDRIAESRQQMAPGGTPVALSPFVLIWTFTVFLSTALLSLIWRSARRISALEDRSLDLEGRDFDKG